MFENKQKKMISRKERADEWLEANNFTKGIWR